MNSNLFHPIVFLLVTTGFLAGCGQRETSPSLESLLSQAGTSPASQAQKPTPVPTIPPLADVEQKISMPPFCIYVSPSACSFVLFTDGQPVFQTNAVSAKGLVPDLPDGTYQLLLSADGYEVIHETLELNSQASPIYFSMKKLSGTLKIKSNAGVLVTVRKKNGDSWRLGRTDSYGIFNAVLQEGSYNLTLSKKGFYPLSEQQTIRAGRPVRIEEVLAPMPGQIWLASPRLATVWEGTNELGVTETSITNLAAGKHVLSIRAPGYKTAQMTVTITPGASLPLVAPTLSPAVGDVAVMLKSSVASDSLFDSLEKTVRLNEIIHTQIDNTVHFAQVPYGAHDVFVSVPSYTMTTQPPSVLVDDENTNRVDVMMTPQPAHLTITVPRATALIYQGTNALGYTGRPLYLPAFQSQQLELYCPGYQTTSFSVPPLAPGIKTNYTVNLIPEVLIEDLVIIEDAEYPPLEHLAAGSYDAQFRQKRWVEESGYPLEVTTSKARIPFRLIPAGSFQMGSSMAETGRERDESQPLTEENEKTRNEVELPHSCYIGKTEITQKQWRKVMGENPAAMKDAGFDAPVESVSWEDCQDFLYSLCDLEGVPQGTYRLLTEAEWEYACRAGTKAATYAGDCEYLGENNAPELGKVAWYAGNSGVDYPGAWPSGDWPEKQENHLKAGTHSVAQKLPNAWGLYDMLGNVWEWCEDRYFPLYPPGPLVNPSGPDDGRARVCRGGAWYTNAKRCRSAERYQNTPLYTENNLGLRIARKLPELTH